MIKLLIAGFLAGCAILFAQSPLPRTHVQNVNGWWNYMGDHPIGDTKWGLHLEGQVRRYDILPRWQQLLIRPGVNYAIRPNIIVAANYGYIATSRYGDAPIGVPFPEHRTSEQIQINQKVGRAGASHRFRLEQRRLGELSVAPNGERTLTRYRFENRIRYMYRILIPVKGKWSVALSNEIMINFGKNVAANTFDQNRAYAAVGYNLPGKSRLEVGFMEQTVQQRNGRVFENNHTLMVSVFSSMPFGKRRN